MTATEVSVSVPANYPAGSWIEDSADYFYVPPELRGWYSDPGAAPSKHQRQRLRQNVPMPGGGPVMVDYIVIDGNGRHAKAEPRQMGQAESRGLLGQYRPVMVKVDPDASTDTMAYKTWEHDVRLEAAQRAAKIDASFAVNHQVDLARACPICGTANPQAIGLMGVVEGIAWSSFLGKQFCTRCLPAVQLAAAERHQQRYQQAIDEWLDDHLTEWQPRPPERSEVTVSQRW